jgi:DNA (cytosine-5)-methyltransferase 1
MKHLGSVTDIRGNEVEPVDVITFGSPCQDLSVAGKRAGLKHTDNGDDETTRSGLFMEAVRIIKEMREATGGKYPRFALWENVPGAFSSNKGEDFRVVCEELIKVVEPTAVMPAVPQKGWSYADYFCGDGWSLAYRVLDAQYWGVPQRRRRIYLVLDLGGERAREVLFEREGLRGHFTESRTPWQAAPGNVADCSGAADCKGSRIVNLNKNDVQSKAVLDPAGIAPALYSGECRGGGGECYVLDKIPCTLEPGIAAREGGHVYEGVSGTLRANAGDNQMAVAYCGSFLPQKKTESMAWSTDDVSGTLHNGACPGFQNAVILSDALPFDTTQVTSPMNYSNPKWGDPCHPLAAGAHPPAVVSKMILDDQGGSQISVRTDGVAPTLRAETHGNLPCVMCYDARGNGEGRIAPTLTGDHQNRVTDYTAVICLQGNGIDRADTAGCNGKGWNEDTCYTLNTIDRPAVAYSLETFHCTSEEEKTTTLKARDYKDPMCVAYGVDCRNYTETPETYPTLQAKSNGGQSLNYSGAVRVQYIVRRLTTIECARLQGFPDRWGYPDHKPILSDEEYEFWLNVRNTHAAINGKATKEYTKAQMTVWYNKLHTDSSEYKMWGNGIALPTALYVMQGIAGVFGDCQ